MSKLILTTVLRKNSVSLWNESNLICHSPLEVYKENSKLRYAEEAIGLMKIIISFKNYVVFEIKKKLLGADGNLMRGYNNV
jgi:hypothetical protein